MTSNIEPFYTEYALFVPAVITCCREVLWMGIIAESR